MEGGAGQDDRCVAFGSPSMDPGFGPIQCTDIMNGTDCSGNLYVQ